MTGGNRPFRLIRFFVLTSVLGAVLLVPAWFLYNRHLAFHTLLEHESRANVALTKVFANTIWSRYAGFVAHSSGLDRVQLLARPEIRALRADVLRQMRGTHVAKIKLYNLDGLTVFSTDERQIGEDKSDNDGFLRAKRGEVESVVTFRNKFDAFEGELSDRNLIASYIPVRESEAAAVQGVFEVYSDVTQLVAELERTQQRIALGLFTSLVCLFLFLFFIVRRADQLLQAQEGERAANEERIRLQAYHDALTGLPNRASFTERLHEVAKLAKRLNSLFAVMFLDLDRFKEVNDSLGHDAGDELLKIVAGRLVACVRDSDNVFRMGGDEFMILLRHVKHSKDAAYVAQRVLDSFSDPIRVHDHEVSVGASIGITIFPTDDTLPENLVKNADAAMYHAKECGRNRYEFYRRDIGANAAKRP